MTRQFTAFFIRVKYCKSMAHCQLSNLIKKQFWEEEKNLILFMKRLPAIVTLNCLMRYIGNLQLRNILLCEL